ncbi:M48 family metallopeptidase [Oceanobacter mangrovi]|uniref:M48 family metallopeptidase n=1 Tax=Oceanobacter mangrovi TaxID=2862510 RepID=UPI001C8E43AD|nr:M48 family metallopeptidase [Oceanobacter mangrovi]
MSGNQFAAHAFYQGYANGKSSGTLTLSDGLLRFDGGGKQVTLALDRVQLKMGGASNRLVYITDPSQPDWTLYCSDRSILKHPLFKAHPELFQQSRKARAHRNRGWYLLAVVALLVLFSPVALYLSMSPLTRMAANQVPPEWEAEMGKSVFAQYQVNYQMLPQQQAQDLLLPITAPLLAALPPMPYEYQFYVANDASINAFALPGGYIVIHSGLILEADNANELLGVLAHEISHVTQKHSLRNIISTMGTYVVVGLVLGDATGLAAVLADAAPLLLRQSYSRDFEREADREGFVLLQRANIDPRGLQSFFVRLREEEQKRLQALTDGESNDLVESSYALLSTHPATGERINNIGDMIAAAAPVTSYISVEPAFERLQQAVSRFVSGSEQEKNKDEGND